jgi:hypothetical protein
MKPNAAVVQTAIKLLNTAASPESGYEPSCCHSRRTSTTAQSNRPQGPRHCQRGRRPQGAGKAYHMGPIFTGRRDWPSGADNPKTNVMFMPSHNLCFDTTPRADRDPAQQFRLQRPRLPPGKDKAAVDAISAETGKTLWSYVTNCSPVLATAGGLVFTVECTATCAPTTMPTARFRGRPALPLRRWALHTRSMAGNMSRSRPPGLQSRRATRHSRC